MAVITETFANSGSFTIPSNAVNITYSIRGARGGTSPGAVSFDGSGEDDLDCAIWNGNPQTDSRGQQGQWLTGSFDASMAGKTVSFQKGLNGVDNLYNYGNSSNAGSLGGAGYHNGGPGGCLLYTSPSPRD